jgi:hypothetical protein
MVAGDPHRVRDPISHVRLARLLEEVAEHLGGLGRRGGDFQRRQRASILRSQLVEEEVELRLQVGGDLTTLRREALQRRRALVVPLRDPE